MMFDYGYGHWSGFGLIWMLLFAALIVVPFWRILPRNGIPNWVALFAIIPLFALVLLWVVAFKDEIGGGKG
jgi:hypothetical protein